ncbi:MAG: penicillin-binding protein 2 [Thermostichales cyanobacterium SZTDM-1c_bins_54]
MGRAIRRRRPLPPTPDPFRLWSLGLALLLACLGLGSRLVFLQAVQGSRLQGMAVRQQQHPLRGMIPRREIVDRRSIRNQQAEWLAVDRPTSTLWVHPRLLSKQNLTPAEVAERLAPILQRDPEAIRRRLEVSHAVRLERHLSPEKVRQLRALGIDAIDLVNDRQRIYPQKEVAAAITGYVQLDDYEGKAGLERSEQTLLERSSQPLVIAANRDGLPLPAEVPKGFLQSSETVLQTTLDMRLQRAAYKALQQRVEQFRADRGTVIVLNPHSGEVLALAVYPSYDPNRYFDGYDPALFRTWAVSDLYEPGSTFKPINIAIALEKGAIQADTRIYDQGRITVGGWPIQNFDFRERGAHGWLSISEILARSSNVGMVHIVERLNPRQYYESLQQFGLGQPNGIDLPFAATSRLKDQGQFVRVAVERATTAFGQGFSLTPMDLAVYHAAIANGGRRITPYVVRGLVEKQTDQLVWQPARPAPIPILSPATTQIVRSMLLDVVEKGTGQSARIPGYAIGGKTGTAQKANPRGGGYLPGVRITSFVAYFPALDPRYVLLAVVDNPKGDDAFGSTVAAPIVKEVIQEIIALEALALHPEQRL